MKYTVLVLYPDYETDNYGTDTFMTCVEADNVHEAQVKAQQEALAAVTEGREEVGEFEFTNYVVLMVIEGEHFDIKQ